MDKYRFEGEIGLMQLQSGKPVENGGLHFLYIHSLAGESTDMPIRRDIPFSRQIDVGFTELFVTLKSFRDINYAA